MGGATRSYSTLLNQPELITTAQFMKESVESRVGDYFSNASKLTKLILSGHGEVKLSKAEKQRFFDWMDLNSQYVGDYSSNRIERRKPSRDGERALRKFIAKRFSQALAEQPYAALVNVGEPMQSRILKAPLAVKSGGWGQVKNGFANTSDPDYKKLKDFVLGSIVPLRTKDHNGTCNNVDKCRCGSCFVKKIMLKNENDK